MADVNEQGPVEASEAALVLVADGDRRWEPAPADVGIGVVRLSGWQVHPLASPESFEGRDSYLVKLNYELALEPGVPAPPWFEVGFRLSDTRESEPVAVLDALPRAVFEPSGPLAYGVSDYLSFSPLPGSGSAMADLPALQPFVDVFGVGHDEIRWRYMAPGTDGGVRGVRPGSYVSWVIVLVPNGCAELDVQLTVRYDLDPDAALGCLPGSRSGLFRLPLPPRSAAVAPVALPSAEPAPAGDPAPAERPMRVFISYAHDDDRHVESVRVFAEFLAAGCGLDVHMDRWDLQERRDWYLWAGEQVRQADYVIVVASPMCRRAGDGEMDNTRHRGLQSEMGLLRELLHSDRASWTRKLLPVVLPGGSVTDLPLFLQPRTADHYKVADLTLSGAEDLIRVITGQPPYRRPDLSTPPVLPPRLRAL